MKRSEHAITVEKLFEQAQKFLQTGEAESAEAICADALNQYPDEINLLCLSARALIKLRRFDDANARIESALSFDPEVARAYEVRGELLFAKGDLPAAADAFQRTLKLDPKRQRARLKLGQVFMYMGRVEEAEELKSDFMNLSQDNQDIAEAAKLEKEEKPAEAEKLYRKILVRHPDNVSAMRLWARLGIKQ